MLRGLFKSPEGLHTSCYFEFKIFKSICPSFFATTVVTTASPRQLLIQINIPMIGPIPITSVTDSTGTFSCVRRKDVRITPEPGTPGAPRDNSMIVTAKDSIALSISKPYIFYEDVLDANGNPRQLQTTKIKYKDVMGRACVLGMCQDVTDLVSIQHEQAMTKEAYESAVNTGLMYNHIAQTLARDYTEMFYVNTDTEEFTEYRKGEESGALEEVRRGWHFFSDCKVELSESVCPDDKEAFLAAMNRKRLMKALAHKDTFVMTYRRLVRGKPVYVSMKISRMENDEQFIIIGFMVLAFTSKEELCTWLWTHRRLLVYDP